MYQEIKAQIDWVEKESNHAITIDHLDTHHLILKNKVIERAFLDIAKERNIPIRFDPRLSVEGAKEVVHPDVFERNFSIVDVRVEKIREIIEQYRSSTLVVELLTHSGYVDDYTKTVTSYVDRDKELAALKEAHKLGYFNSIELISFDSLKENSFLGALLKNWQDLKEKGVDPKIDSIMVSNNQKVEKYFPAKQNLHELRSISKVMVALAILRAVDQKIVRLNSHVYPIIRKVCAITNKRNIPKIKKWKIKHLLTYTAGYDKQMFNEKAIRDIHPKEYLSYMLNYESIGSVGKKYEYNNAELFLLSVVFQELTGENIKDYIAHELFLPLGITEYKWDNYDKYCPGGTGLYLKAEDLFKIGQLLLQKGQFAGQKFVSKKNVQRMCTTRLKTPYAVKPQRVLPKQGVGFVMHISRDHYVFKDGTNGQYLIINFKKQQLITILSSEPNMSVVTEVLRGLV